MTDYLLKIVPKRIEILSKKILSYENAKIEAITSYNNSMIEGYK